MQVRIQRFGPTTIAPFPKVTHILFLEYLNISFIEIERVRLLHIATCKTINEQKICEQAWCSAWQDIIYVRLIYTRLIK